MLIELFVFNDLPFDINGSERAIRILRLNKKYLVVFALQVKLKRVQSLDHPSTHGLKEMPIFLNP